MLEQAEIAEAETRLVDEETEADHIHLHSQAYERVNNSWIRRNYRIQKIGDFSELEFCSRKVHLSKERKRNQI